MRHGVARAVATLAILIAGLTTRVGAQISPGPLARAHAALEGPLNCTKCHGGRSTPMDQLCTACHKEIAWLVAQNRGLHARDAQGKCARCHPDHAGREFALITWKEGSAVQFDHARTGWKLEGKHAEQQCSACHASTYRVGPAATRSPREKTPGWVGLEQTCTSCHEDVHHGSLGTDCTSCHGLDGWKPASQFDHDRTDYRLTGKHVDVACDKCHQAPSLNPPRNARGELVSVFKPVPHRDCVSCHADPHGGRLTGACRTCHTTASFTVIDKTGFDHDHTRYPLRGKHAAVACDKCHVGFPKSGMHPAFGSCASCHADPHNGAAVVAGRAADCVACHDLNGFAPATFSIADHRKTAYPLEGKHATVKCSACHVSRVAAGALVSRGVRTTIELRPAFARCTSCHADDHAGQLAWRTDKGACESCHQVAGWTPTTFAPAAHAALKLPLEGKHAMVACGACHKTTRAGLPPFPAGLTAGKAAVVFHLTETACAACHADPHAGRFARGGERAQTAGCVGCHDARAFRPSTITDAVHAQFSFALEGAHRAVPCASCHAELKRPASTASTLLLASRSTAPPLTLAAKHECVSCHTSPHGSQFAARADKGACEGCHGLDAFTPASHFDHDRDARFKLQGAHARVACAQCHTPAAGAGPHAPVKYRGTPTTCEACHSGTTPATASPSRGLR